MATRDELYKRFGPAALEAVVHVMFSEINILRQRAGLAERTMQQGLDALEAQLDALTKYSWTDDLLQ